MACIPRLLKQITEELKGLTAKRPRWKRIVNYEGDAARLADMKQKVVEEITRIQVQLFLLLAAGESILNYVH